MEIKISNVEVTVVNRPRTYLDFITDLNSDLERSYRYERIVNSPDAIFYHYLDCYGDREFTINKNDSDFQRLEKLYFENGGK